MNTTYTSSSTTKKYTWFNILSIAISCIVLIQMMFANQFIDTVSLYNNFDLNINTALYSLLITLVLFGLSTTVVIFLVRNYLKQ